MRQGYTLECQKGVKWCKCASRNDKRVVLPESRNTDYQEAREGQWWGLLPTLGTDLGSLLGGSLTGQKAKA